MAAPSCCWDGWRLRAGGTRARVTLGLLCHCLSNLTCPLCPLTGPVTNAFIVLAPANMFNPDGKPSVPLPKFSRHLHGTESSDEPGTEGVTLRLGLHQQVLGGPGARGGWADIQEGLCPTKLLLRLVEPAPAPSRFLPILAAAVICPLAAPCCSVGWLCCPTVPSLLVWLSPVGREGHTPSPIPASLPVVPELLPSASSVSGRVTVTVLPELDG